MSASLPPNPPPHPRPTTTPSPWSSLVFYSSLHSPLYSTSLSPSSIRFSRSITLLVHVPFISPSACPTCWHEFFLPSYCISLLFPAFLCSPFIFRSSVHLPPPLPPLPPLCQAQALSLLFIRLAVERLHSCWQCCLCELSAELHSPLASHSPPPPTSTTSTTSTAALPPHPPPSLSPFLLPPTYIPLQAGELTFQPRAAGLNDCLWGWLWLHNPAANIWATHTHSHHPRRRAQRHTHATHNTGQWHFAACTTLGYSAWFCATLHHY